MDGEGKSERSAPGDKRQFKSVVVVIGIALFVLGFIITVSSLSSNGTGGDEGVDRGALSTGVGAGSLTLVMVLGMIVSLTGVLIATVGPMASFIQGKSS